MYKFSSTCTQKIFPKTISRHFPVTIKLGKRTKPSFPSIIQGIQGDHTFLDPTLQEEEFCCSSSAKSVQPHGLISIAYLSSIGQLSATSVVGCVDARQITDCLDSLILHCGEVAELARLRLSKDVLKKCKEEEDVESNEISS